MSLSSDWVNAVAAVASAAAAGAALLTAGRANRTAETLARIEQDRRRSELTPQFQLRLEPPNGNRANLHVLLEGPDGLGHLDSVRISIRDDDMLHEARPGGEPTQEQLDAFVWGPYRFPFGADGADALGRGVAPFDLEVGAGRPLVLERTRPGPWMGSMSQEEWQAQYQGFPIRLVLECRRGEDWWRLERQLEQPRTTGPIVERR